MNLSACERVSRHHNHFFIPAISNAKCRCSDSFCGGLPDVFNETTILDQLGIYLQDQIDILDNLILVAGLSYDTVNRETTLNIAESEHNYDALTLRISIVCKPIEPISSVEGPDTSSRILG